MPDGTPMYEGWTVFWPRVDVPPNEATSAYEREGYGRDVRTFAGYSGNDVYGFPGTHVHGDDLDFRGLAMREKYFADGDPVAPCEGIGIFLGLRLGLEVLDVEAGICVLCPGLDPPSSLRVTFECPDIPLLDGQTILVPFDFTPGYCYWSVFDFEVPGGTVGFNIGMNPAFAPSLVYHIIFQEDEGELFFEGPELTSDYVCDPLAISGSTTIGSMEHPFGFPISFFAEPGDGPLPAETLDVGFTIGAEILDGAEIIPIGLAVKLDVTDVEPTTEEIPIGFLIGIEHVHVANPTERMSPRFEIGIEVVDV